jgi:hypothetical protein
MSTAERTYTEMGATKIATSRGTYFFNDSPAVAQETLNGRGGGFDLVRRRSPGECVISVTEIERVPMVRVVSGEHAGQEGALLRLGYDLTNERYDRFYYAMVEGVMLTGLRDYHAMLKVEDCEIDGDVGKELRAVAPVDGRRESVMDGIATFTFRVKGNAERLNLSLEDQISEAANKAEAVFKEALPEGFVLTVSES